MAWRYTAVKLPASIVLSTIMMKRYKALLASTSVAAALLVTACANIPAVPADYYKQVQTDFALERTYTARGPSAVQSQVFASGQSNFSEFKVWYPAELSRATAPYPVVVFANGSGTPYRKYEASFERLASWGFVVVGNNDENPWDGRSTSLSLALLERLNAQPDSVFYRKLDTRNAGVAGHSQGGVGAINAVTAHANSGQFTSLFTASSTSAHHAANLQWPFDVSKVRIPYFMVSGTGFWDAGNEQGAEHGIAPLASMLNHWQQLPDGQLTVLARRKNTDHSQMLYLGDGYMTAWFRYTLLNDAEAARVFVGSHAELPRNNQHWQDVRIRPASAR